jgi:gamma-glutamyltranspeptidase
LLILILLKHLNSKDVQAKLLDFGHEMKCFSFGGSVVQGIRKNNNLTIEATSDSRKGGLADGV